MLFSCPALGDSILNCCVMTSLLWFPLMGKLIIHFPHYYFYANILLYITVLWRCEKNCSSTIIEETHCKMMTHTVVCLIAAAVLCTVLCYICCTYPVYCAVPVFLYSM